MAGSHQIDIQFSREDLHRRGARDRLRNPPIVDGAFDSLLARLQSNEGEPGKTPGVLRLKAFRHGARPRSSKTRKA